MSIRRYTIYNLLGQITPLALALVTIPIYLGLIGEARYGVLAIVWLLIGYFGFFDLGLGQATAQMLSRIPPERMAEGARVFWTALVINLALGFLGALVAWPLASHLFASQFTIDAALRGEVMAVLPWIVLTVPAATLSGVLTGALQARERFLELNLVMAVANAAVQLLPLAAAAYDPNLATVVPVVLAARVLGLLLLLQRCDRYVVQGHPPAWDRSVVSQLLRFGSWVTISSFIGPMMVILDRFVIGALFGARAVSHYTIPFQLAERSALLSSALNSALFPRLSMASDAADRRKLGLDGLRALVVVMSPLMAVAILLIGPFLAWWISAELAQQAARLAQVLCVGFWLNALALVPYTMLHAAGRPDLVAKCHVAELLPYLALLYLALQGWGLVGAAAVFSLRAAIDFILLARFAGVLAASVSLLFMPGSLMAVAFAVATPGWLAPWWQAMLGGVATLLLMAWSLMRAPASLRLWRPLPP